MITKNTHRYLLGDEVPEGTTPHLTGTLRDHQGDGVPAASLSALHVTIYNETTEAILRARSSALNTGIGAVNGSGEVTLALTAGDTAIVDDTKATELRVALLEAEWTDGGIPKQAKFELVFVVRNLKQVPAS